MSENFLELLKIDSLYKLCLDHPASPMNDELKTSKKLKIAIVSVVLILTVTLFVVVTIKSKKTEIEQGGIKAYETGISREKHAEEITNVSPEVKSASPVEVIRYGWRPVFRTVPTPGYIWEWAVEIENKTRLVLSIHIKYNLFNDEGIKVAEGKTGELIEGKSRQTIVSQAVAPEEISQAKRSVIEISVSPHRANAPEDIEEGWHWTDPYTITIQ